MFTMENPKDFSKELKKPFLQGLFYPADIDELEKMLQTEMSLCQLDLSPGNAFIIPHGAYDFTLKSLIYALKRIYLYKPEVLYFFAPFHNELSNTIYSPLYADFNYPGGNVKVENYYLNTFDDITFSNIPFDEETSFEPLLPLFNLILPDTEIIPFYFSENISKEKVLSLKNQLEDKHKNPGIFVSANTKINIQNSDSIFCSPSVINTLLHVFQLKFTKIFTDFSVTIKKEKKIKHEVFELTPVCKSC